jgi:hypothetical protein
MTDAMEAGGGRPGGWRPTLSQAHREAALIDEERRRHARDHYDTVLTRLRLFKEQP